MSTYVLMKVLESTPERYDRGIRILSGGAIDRVYEEIARRAAAPGRRVLDLGCGTGGVTLTCAARGAAVVGIEDALRFRFADGRVVEPATIRSTRVNMLGRRTVKIAASDSAASRPDATP